MPIHTDPDYVPLTTDLHATLEASVAALVDAIETTCGTSAPSVLEYLARYLEAEILTRGHSLKLYPVTAHRNALLHTLVQIDIDHVASLALMTPALAQWVASAVKFHSPYSSASPQHLVKILKHKMRVGVTPTNNS